MNIRTLPSFNTTSIIGVRFELFGKWSLDTLLLHVKNVFDTDKDLSRAHIFFENTPLMVDFLKVAVDLANAGVYPKLKETASLPDQPRIVTKLISDHVFGNYSLEELRWWSEDYSLYASGITYIVFRNDTDLLAYCKKNAYALPMMFRFPNLVYPNTRRPVVDMTKFQQPIRVENVLNDSAFNNARLTAGFLPVLRYANLFTSPVDKQNSTRFCGTYFYLEPDSNALLYCPRLLVAPNKIRALQILRDKIGDLNVKTDITKSLFGYENSESTAFIYEALSDNGMMTPAQFKTFLLQFKNCFEYFPIPNSERYFTTDIASDRPFYVGHIVGLYAQEDKYDQIMCTSAKLYGYDAIYLTHMVGMYGIVGEVNDVRDRETTFSNLYFKATCHLCGYQTAERICAKCNTLVCNNCS